MSLGVAPIVVLIVVRRGTDILQLLGFGSRVLRPSHEHRIGLASDIAEHLPGSLRGRGPGERDRGDFNADMEITRLDQENSVGW